MSPRWKSRLLALVTLAIFAVAIFVLRKSLAGMQWPEVRQHLEALPATHVAIAMTLTFGSYAALTLYDLLAVRFVGSALPWRQVAPTSFIAYALGHNLGLSTLTGGALRLHDYSRRGLSPAQVAGIVAMCAITFGMGVNVLFTLALLLEPEVASKLLHISPAAAMSFATLNFGFLLLWLWLTTGRRDKTFTLGGHQFTPPTLGLSARQIAVSMLDLCCSSAAFYWLLPGQPSISYPAFVGCYVLAMAAGIASNVPGGLGVFENVLLLTLPDTPKEDVVGAVLAFRAVYYLLPFLLAVLMLVARELPDYFARNRQPSR